MVHVARAHGSRRLAERRWPRTTLWLRRVAHGFRRAWRWCRIQVPVAAVLGPQYRRSRERIEIDITYRCNLSCPNCNRSCAQAPEALDLPLARVSDFVDASIRAAKRWRSIRVLGGEPSLHPQFHQVIGELRRYTAWNPGCALVIVSNGHGPFVRAQLDRLPHDAQLEDAEGRGRTPLRFRPFNLAPRDDWRFSLADFRSGCTIMEECGTGLGPTGYFPCAVAAGIDRVLNWGGGRPTLPGDDDDMLDLSERCCAMCGLFRDGHHVSPSVRPDLVDGPTSPSWREAYASHRERRGR
jgi:hypothetical protein